MYWFKLLYPGINIKRWILLFALSIFLLVLGGMIFFKENFFSFLTNIHQSLEAFKIKMLAIACIFSGLICFAFCLRGLNKSLFRYFLQGDEKFFDIFFSKQLLHKGPAITVIGGGTGLATLLRGIKQITSNCTAVVAVTDDGGSSGKLRKEFGIIPPGDLRNCITALADTEPTMAKLMQYRFKEGTSLSGHSFGNLFIAAMADIAGDMEKGLSSTNEILKVCGNVIPATLESVTLIAKMQDDTFVKGESNITSEGKKIKELMLFPDMPKATNSAVQSILQADIIVVGPGSLYTSVITNFLVPEIKQAIIDSKAAKIYICNVMTQPGETDGFTAYDHVKAIYEYVDKEFFDFVVVNNQKVSEEMLEKYALQRAYPVQNDSEKIDALGARVIEANLISIQNLVRHEPVQLANAIFSIIYSLKLSGHRFKVFDYFLAKENLHKIKKTFEGD